MFIDWSTRPIVSSPTTKIHVRQNHPTAKVNYFNRKTTQIKSKKKSASNEAKIEKYRRQTPANSLDLFKLKMSAHAICSAFSGPRSYEERK